MKPKVFIGSSSEGLSIANAIHSNLTRQAECTVWDKGVFIPSTSTLSSLINTLRTSDFGIFVFSPDDITIMREMTNPTVRDNVIFELGLFIGRLGAERCYFLVPENAGTMHLPSDLAGITPLVYENNRSDGNLTAALNPACMQIGNQLEKLKSFQDVNITSDAAPIQKPKDTVRRTPKKVSSKEVTEGVTIESYGKGYLVKGNTKPHKEKIKENGGKWNGSLQGWIISPSMLSSLKAAIPSASMIS
ncbi:TIR domain-containing protein [Brucella pituitosa]|uniref:TIR domain-containing protein n=1 Tax=Brucella pituitosa TaxID=571256 RepID=UPI00147874BD|nr:nucleotide-binding protein [Brucella pituitosa]